MARYEDDEDDDRDDEEESPSVRKKRKRSDPTESGFLGFLLYRKFVGDWIIIILSWLGVIGSVIFGFVAMIGGIIAAARGGGGGGGAAVGIIIALALALVYIIVVPIMIRVYAEMAVLFYRMQEHLREIRDNTR
jgi:Domain of unknown function (DUF4282)